MDNSGLTNVGHAIASTEYDVFRDGPVRYLGYANEIGEAFRKQIGKYWVAATYGVATVYVLADTGHKTSRAYQGHNDQSTSGQAKKTIIQATDTLLWQSFASVIIPGITINRLCALSARLLKKTELPKKSRKWIVTGIGLAAIPFIIKPIDAGVDTVMDSTFRKWTT